MARKLLIFTFINTVMLLSCDVDINPGSGGFTISKNSHDFGGLYIGDIAQFDFILKNSTKTSVSINSIQFSGADISDFFITNGGDYPFVVNANDKHTLTVAFSPGSTGSKNATMTINYGTNKTFVIDLFGKGNSVNKLMLLPEDFDFGPIAIGDSSSINITLNNGSNNGVTVAGVEIQGANADDFSIVSGANVPIFVDANSMFVFTVQFVPLTEGDKSAVFHVVMEDGVTTFDTNLTGSGEIVKSVNVNPSSYDFGNVGINSTVEKTFTLMNTGNSDVVVTDISILNDLHNAYLISDGELVGSMTLAPSETYDFTVAFSPLTDGVKKANFSVSFIGDGSPFVGEIVGSGTDQPTLSPEDADFGSVQIGETSAALVFSFTNPTSSAINITNIEIAGTDASSFVSDPVGSGNWSVNADGGALQISVKFMPGKEGLHDAVLNVTAGSAYQATMSGTGISAPLFDIEPTSYDFGSVITGTMDSKQFKVTNNGTGVLSLSAVDLLNDSEGNFAIASGSNGLDISPGTSEFITVSFMPVTRGNKSATLRIIHNASGSPAFITLEGEGAEIALVPGNIDFGSIEIGTTSGPQTFTVKNSTNSSITLSKIYFTGADAFRFTSNPIGGISQVVPANGGTYQFTVTCSPISVGVINAVVNVDFLNGTLQANVKAEGIERPVLNITPAYKNYGYVRLGNQAEETFVIRNIGTGTLTLSSISFINNTGGDFVITSGGGSDIKITTSPHYLKIVFKPLTFGPKSCTLRIEHNGTGSPTSPLNVALSGNAIGPEFNLIPNVSAYAFGDCYVGKTKEKLFYISNGGDQTLLISGIQLSNNTDYSITGINLPAYIPAGKSIEIFTLVFNPRSSGNKNATLTVTHNSVNSPKSVSISGTAISAPGELSTDFESNPTNWSSSGEWEWGIPRNTTYPSSAHSGSRCFGTNIDGNYGRGQNCYLASPIVDLSKASAPVLTFYMYVYCYSIDGGWVEISTDGGNSWSRNLSPSPAYNNTVNNGGGYNLNSNGWVEVTIDLSMAAGKSQVQLAWYFYSDYSSQASGWYIDDVSITDSAIPYPYNPVPYDNDINVVPVSNKFTMKWDCDGANSYDVYLSQTYPPTTRVAKAITAKSYIASLTADRKYFWKVVANHPNSVTKTSQVWYFETVSAVPDVLINECDTRYSIDWVEIYNTEDHPVYIGGWELTIYADNNSNPDGTFVFPIGLVLQPGELVVVNDNQASTNTVYRTDFNIEWANATSPGEVIFTYPTDYNKTGVDYMKFNTLYNHKPADLSWSGSLTSNNTSQSSWYRIRSTDSDSSADWRVRSSSNDKGSTNPGQ